LYNNYGRDKKYVKNNLCARVTSRRRRKSLIGVGVNGIADARAEIDIEMNDCAPGPATPVRQPWRRRL